MNNNFSENGKTGMRLHLAEPSALRGTRTRVPKPEPTNAFAIELRGFFQTAAMSQQEFAEVLSLELSRTVSQVNLSNWLNGAVPRTPGTNGRRPDESDLADTVLAAARRIAENESHAGRQKYADPKEVEAQFLQWEELGLSAKQIQLAAEISVSLYRSWRSGAKIRTPRWTQAVTKVKAWLEFLAEYKARNAQGQ